ncbi:MAG TPA: glycerate kinase [Phycisphaerales bacterium]|nr:glycerate kinase [Phycisphaerales bacterium]
MGERALRVLVASDKFKGTLSAREACGAIAEGARRAAAAWNERADEAHRSRQSAGSPCHGTIQIQVDECPLADGGEGTLDIVSSHVGAVIRNESVAGPDGHAPIRTAWAEWFDESGERCAIIESARVIGLGMVGCDDAGPMARTSFGLGELIGIARNEGCTRIFVALGGTATVDGGIGCAQALGAQFLIGEKWTDDRVGFARRFIERFDGTQSRAITAEALLQLSRVISSAHRPAEGVPPVEVVGLCDVDNPLLGEHGAARVFGPQKGATAEQVEALEKGLENLVRLCEEAKREGVLRGEAEPDAPGAGAAGGLGFGLRAFLGARLVRGAEYVMDVVRFDERLAGADVVITGEGKLDRQSIGGKVVFGVGKRCWGSEWKPPCLVVVGRVDEPHEELLREFERAGAGIVIVEEGGDERGGREAIVRATERAMTKWLETVKG